MTRQRFVNETHTRFRSETVNLSPSGFFADPMFFHQSPHRCAAHLQFARGRGNLAMMTRQGGHDHVAFGTFARRRYGAFGRRWRDATGQYFFREITDFEHGSLADRNRSLNDVLQLPNVAWIVEREERIPDWLRATRHASTAVKCNEMLDQPPNVPFALAEWWQVNAMHVQSIEEIAAKVPTIDRLLEIDVRGGKKPNVHHATLVLANATHLTRLDGSKQFCLKRIGHCPDFVEKHGAARSVFDEAGARARGTCERTTRVSEELVLEQ